MTFRHFITHPSPVNHHGSDRPFYYRGLIGMTWCCCVTRLSPRGTRSLTRASHKKFGPPNTILTTYAHDIFSSILSGVLYTHLPLHSTADVAGNITSRSIRSSTRHLRIHAHDDTIALTRTSRLCYRNQYSVILVVYPYSNHVLHPTKLVSHALASPSVILPRTP